VSRLVVGVREAPGHPCGPQIAADIGMTVDTSRPHLPDSSCPDGSHSGSSGRSIRWRLLVTTFLHSVIDQCVGGAAAVSADQQRLVTRRRRGAGRAPGRLPRCGRRRCWNRRCPAVDARQRLPGFYPLGRLPGPRWQAPTRCPPRPGNATFSLPHPPCWESLARSATATSLAGRAPRLG